MFASNAGKLKGVVQHNAPDPIYLTKNLYLHNPFGEFEAENDDVSVISSIYLIWAVLFFSRSLEKV